MLNRAASLEVVVVVGEAVVVVVGRRVVVGRVVVVSAAVVVGCWAVTTTVVVGITVVTIQWSSGMYSPAKLQFVNSSLWQLHWSTSVLASWKLAKKVRAFCHFSVFSNICLRSGGSNGGGSRRSIDDPCACKDKKKYIHATVHVANIKVTDFVRCSTHTSSHMI